MAYLPKDPNKIPFAPGQVQAFVDQQVAANGGDPQKWREYYNRLYDPVQMPDYSWEKRGRGNGGNNGGGGKDDPGKTPDDPRPDLENPGHSRMAPPSARMPSQGFLNVPGAQQQMCPTLGMLGQAPQGGPQFQLPPEIMAMMGKALTMQFNFANNPLFSPQNLLTLSGNILAAPSLPQGLGTGLQQLGTNLTAQQKEQAERQKQMQEQTQADNYLRQQNPGVDISNFTPGMINAAASSTLDKQLNPAKPEFRVLDDGSYGTWDGTKFNVLGKAQKPEKLPAIAEEYNWARENGFTGSPQEYQVWKANLSKQKGMIIEQTADGFRMVQGDVDTAKMPNLTEAQGKNAGFLKRALSAEKELTDLEGEGTSLWNATAGKVPIVGNGVISSDAQKFNQAQRNFINAVLRRESGAVISPEEFENARQQYFPQPFDGPEVIAQKKKNRQDAIAGFEIGSGPAAEKVREMDEQPKSEPIPAEEYFK